MVRSRSVRVTKKTMKNVSASARRSSKKTRAKAARSGSSRQKKGGSQSVLSDQMHSRKTWLVIGAVFIVAFLLQQFNVVSLVVQDDVLPQCSKDEHCAIGKSCIFDRCYAHTPAYPEIGRIKMYTGYGKEVMPNSQGLYEVEPDQLMSLSVQADNDHKPFQIHVYSQIGFGQKGLEKNRKTYFSTINAGDEEYKNLYWVNVDEEIADNYYPFYFDLLGFKGEEYTMFVYLKNASDYQKEQSEILELPIKIV